MITGVSSGAADRRDCPGPAATPIMFRISPDDLQDGAGHDRVPGLEKAACQHLVIVAEDSDFGRGGDAAFTPLAQKAGLFIPSTDFTPQMTPGLHACCSRASRSASRTRSPFSCWGRIPPTCSAPGCKWASRSLIPGGPNPPERPWKLIQAGGMEGSVSAWTYSPEIDNRREQEIRRLHHGQAQDRGDPAKSWGGYDCMCGRWPRRSAMPRATTR